MKPTFFRHQSLPYLESRYTDNSSACYGMHSHPTVSIGLIVSGHSIVDVNEQQYRLKADDIVMFNAEQPHACNPVKDTKWSYHMLYFEKNWWREVIACVSPDQTYETFQYPILNHKKLCTDLCNINGRLLDVKDPNDYVEIELDLLMWINRFISCLDPAKPSQDAKIPDWIFTLQNYLVNHANRPVKLEELCRISQTSKTQLIRRFKQYCGLTPYAYLQNYRINQARKLLVEGETISDVAYQLGFADQSHLHRLFKRFVACTPKDYQRSLS